MNSKPPSAVSSRFVSQSELDAARSTTSSSSEYDPRSLFERLQAHKEENDAKYDELFKLSNQFRGIDEGESEFLAQLGEGRRREEQERAERERAEVEAFRAARARKGGAGGEGGLVRNVEVPVGGEGEVGKVGGEKEKEEKGAGEKRERAKGEGEKAKEETKGEKALETAAAGAAAKKKRKAGSSLLGIVKKKPVNNAADTSSKPSSTSPSLSAPTRTSDLNAKKT